MKVCSIRLAYWTFVLGIVLTVNGIVAQEESGVRDLAALCNDKRTPDYEWLENYKQQNALNELLQKLSDGDTSTVKYHSRNHIAPRYALYDQGKDMIQYPFASNWKNQINQANWNSAGKSGKIQNRQPFNYDNKRGMNSFSSWGGKRDRGDMEDSMNNKREPAFSSWGGKRTQKFFNWGGKRSIPDDANEADTYDHIIMKRNADPEFKPDTREKRLCITDEMNLQELFKEFINWSRKQPEQKKGSMYRRMFSVSTLHSPDNLSRRAGSFFPWGGKRNSKQN